MDYNSFKMKYLERFIDYDGSYGCQCWDLIQYYNTEVLNVPDSVFSGCGWVGNMVLWEWKYNELLEYFDEIPTTEMKQGDVSIWADPNNEQNCHVAIFDHYNHDDNNCYYFSQNPNPCRIIPINMKGHHAFRRKQEIPPAPEPSPVITPNVPKDEYKNQIEVIVEKLRVRINPRLDSEIIGYANIGLYNYLETTESDGFTWFKISDSNWIASSDEWTIVYPAKKKETTVQITGKTDNSLTITIDNITTS